MTIWQEQVELVDVDRRWTEHETGNSCVSGWVRSCDLKWEDIPCLGTSGGLYCDVWQSQNKQDWVSNSLIKPFLILGGSVSAVYSLFHDAVCTHKITKKTWGHIYTTDEAAATIKNYDVIFSVTSPKHKITNEIKTFLFIQQNYDIQKIQLQLHEYFSSLFTTFCKFWLMVGGIVLKLASIQQ